MVGSTAADPAMVHAHGTGLETGACGKFICKTNRELYFCFSSLTECQNCYSKTIILRFGIIKLTVFSVILFESPHGKTNNLPRRKQRR